MEYPKPDPICLYTIDWTPEKEKVYQELKALAKPIPSPYEHPFLKPRRLDE